jgi:hypothetical protein
MFNSQYIKKKKKRHRKEKKMKEKEKIITKVNQGVRQL